MIQEVIWKLKLTFIPSQANNFRPKFLASQVLIWCLLVLFVLKILTVPFLIYFPKSALFGDISKTALINLLNQDRKEAGLNPLKENSTLNKAANLKVQDMLTKDYFSHQSPEGISPWHWFEQAGYNYKIAGENLAIGFLDSEEVNQAWLDSPSHKANLLNSNYKDVGIAILTGDFQGNETTVVVQLFGAPKPTASALKVQTKETTGPEPENMEKEQTSSTELATIKKEILPALKGAQEKATFSFLYFFSSDYYKILQIIIYGFLGLIILALIINIFVKIDIQHWDLILKALGFIGVLLLFILIDKGAIIKLIPHNFNIY